MLRSPAERTIAVLIVVAGLLAGALLAVMTRPPTPQTIAVSTQQRAEHAPGRATPAPVATAVVSRAPAASPPPVATAVPRMPVPSTTVPSTSVPSAPVTTALPAQPPAAAPVAQGSWEIDEAGTSVGTIVWSGVASRTPDGRTALDVHKSRVANHAVGPCEHETHLRAVFETATAPQRVPYQEVNCSGAVTSGEMRVDAASAHAISGAFWSAGTQVGTFSATTGTAR